MDLIVWHAVVEVVQMIAKGLVQAYVRIHVKKTAVRIVKGVVNIYATITALQHANQVHTRMSCIRRIQHFHQQLIPSNDQNKRRRRTMAVWHVQKHYLHCHQGLPVGVQVLLSSREECQGADVVGDGQGFY
jgi:hypothetical protein